MKHILLALAAIGDDGLFGAFAGDRLACRWRSSDDNFLTVLRQGIEKAAGTRASQSRSKLPMTMSTSSCRRFKNFIAARLTPSSSTRLTHRPPRR